MALNLIMVFDTETTGKTDFKAPYDAPHQPNLVQLGYKVYTPNKDVVWEVGHLVDSSLIEGFNMEQGAQDVHGITVEAIQNHGLGAEKSAKMFNAWANQCQLFVAHNKNFDIAIMQCFKKRTGYSPDIFAKAQTFCTMNSTTNLCKIPNENRGGFKWPKLEEAYKFFIDQRGFGNAHNALADVNACAEIFWYLKDKGLVPIELKD